MLVDMVPRTSVESIQRILAVIVQRFLPEPIRFLSDNGMMVHAFGVKYSIPTKIIKVE